MLVGMGDLKGELGKRSLYKGVPGASTLLCLRELKVASQRPQPRKIRLNAPAGPLRKRPPLPAGALQGKISICV